MKEVVIASACRSAIGTFGGALKNYGAAHLAADVIRESVNRSGIDPKLVDEVRMGCVFEPADACNIARVSALLAGLPESATAMTINRVCISGMEAVISSMAMIQAGIADVVVAGGVEHMSTVPYMLPSARWGAKLQDQQMVDWMIHALHCGSHLLPNAGEGPVDSTRPPLSNFIGKPYIMGHTAEFVAQHFDVGREEMDEVALRSHNRAQRATQEGTFKDEIVPIAIPQKRKDPIIFEKDEHFRKDLTLEDLGKLPPAFVPGGGKVTAGNSSGLNDGATALVMMTAERARELGIEPIAAIKEVGKGACHPSIMGVSPIPAVNDLLDRGGMALNDFELFEINEAFAAQYIAVERELGLDREIVNVNGSGIGLGHPVGSTGARIITTLIYEMQRRKQGLGLATLCGGGGVSMACAIEVL